VAISKRLRYEILRRDNFQCRYCGASAPNASLTVDHVTPVALGGTDSPNNLVTACQPCNNGKSSIPADAAVVDDVAQDALRWATAMKQAAEELRSQAEPRRAYRTAFKQVWDEWTWESNGQRKTFDLPDGWKSSLDKFLEAGLPEEVWPDIIEKAMTNKMVKADNIFRYCCGIAWRMVRDLQERAKAIVGATHHDATTVDPVVQAVLEVWATESGEGAADEEARSSILSSAQSVREQVDAHLIVEAAQYAAWFRIARIDEAIAGLERDKTFEKWQMAWHTLTGDFPDNERCERVTRQVEELLTAGVYVGRVERAAVYAGAHRSAVLHFGLSEAELAVTGMSATFAGAVETWSRAFAFSAGRWPTEEERSEFMSALRRVGVDGGFLIDDVFSAAVASGAYQDPDFTTCLTRGLSVFEAAARPITPSA
jgi:hypothetical protein